jgi:hypothetical protein
MASDTVPTAEYLRQRLALCSETGMLTWREAENMSATWNSRRAGTPAFCSLHKQGYANGKLDGRVYFAHRVVWVLSTGAWPAGEIDHVNHDKRDNRMSNLRLVTKQTNARNLPMLKNNTTGVTGVYRRARGGWHAAIRVAGRLRHLGCFRTKAEAVSARQTAEVRFAFHENHGKLPSAEARTTAA